MKLSYRQAASDDVVRQFRYYLVNQNVPDIAIRFRNSVGRTIQSLRRHPQAGPRFRSSNLQLQNLRSSPVAGFEAIRIYYVVEQDTIRIIRVLHGKQDVQRILNLEGAE